MNYLLTCVKPGSLTHGSRWWNERSSRREYVVRGKSPGLGGCTAPHLAASILSEQNIWHGMSDLWKTRAINTLRLVLKIDFLKTKESTGESTDRCWHRFASPGVCVVLVICSLWACEVRHLKLFRRKVNEWMNEWVLFWGNFSMCGWLKLPIDTF